MDQIILTSNQLFRASTWTFKHTQSPAITFCYANKTGTHTHTNIQHHLLCEGRYQPTTNQIRLKLTTSIKYQSANFTCLFPIFTEVKPDKSTAVICRHSQFLERMIPVNVWVRHFTAVRQVQQCKAVLVVYNEATLLSLPLYHCNAQSHSMLTLHDPLLSQSLDFNMHNKQIV